MPRKKSGFQNNNATDDTGSDSVTQEGNEISGDEDELDLAEGDMDEEESGGDEL